VRAWDGGNLQTDLVYIMLILRGRGSARDVIMQIAIRPLQIIVSRPLRHICMRAGGQFP